MRPTLHIGHKNHLRAEAFVARDPSSTPRTTLLPFSALPPVGQGKAPADAALERPTTGASQRHSALSSHGDSTYFEVLEADVLAAQKRLRTMAMPPGATAVRHYSERELQSLREAGGPLAKLALQEVLSDKLEALERAATDVLTRTWPAAREAVEAARSSHPELSRVAPLVALLDGMDAALQDAGARMAGKVEAQAEGASVAAKARQERAQRREDGRVGEGSSSSLAEAAAMRATLLSELTALDIEVARLAVGASRESIARECAREATRHLAESEATESEALDKLPVRATRLGREAVERLESARAATAQQQLLPPAPPPPTLLSRAPLVAARGVADILILDDSGGGGGSSGDEGLCGGDDGAGATVPAELVAQLTAEVAALRRELDAANASTAALTMQLAIGETERLRASAAAEEARRAHEHARAAAAEACELREQLVHANEAREAAERAATGAARQCELLSKGADGEETFEAVMAAELATMREAYEARLAAAQQALREAHAAHRRELRLLEESVAPTNRRPGTARPGTAGGR
jgi:hypothetical protein